LETLVGPRLNSDGKTPDDLVEVDQLGEGGRRLVLDAVREGTVLASVRPTAAILKLIPATAVKLVRASVQIDDVLEKLYGRTSG
jgi:hypothetical protein